MRQKIDSFPHALLWLFGLTLFQSFLGRWMVWSQAVPEADVAMLVLVSFSMGRIRGALLGSFVGYFHDLFSHHPFGLGTMLFAGVGYAAGDFGASRPWLRHWQKLLFLFVAIFVLDTLFLLLKEWESAPSSWALVSRYQDVTFPSACWTVLVGFFFRYFLYETQET